MEAGAADASTAEPTIDPSVRWIAPGPDELLWMDDGRLAVVFDLRSRQTHVLSPVACRALKLLMAAPLSAAELDRGMAAPAGPTVDRADDDAAGDADPDLAADLLSTFDALGLVEPAGQ